MQKNNIFILLSVFAIFSADGSWKLVNPTYTGSALNDICFISQNEAWIAGNDGVLLHTTNAGDTWETRELPNVYASPLRAILFTNKDSGFTAGGKNGVTYALKTSDNGKTWTDVSEKFPRGEINIIYQKQPGKIWAITSKRDDNLFCSQDNGATWISCSPGKTLLKDILFVNDSTGFVCGDSGFIGRTSNGGTTWTRLTPVSKNSYLRFSFPVADIGYCLDTIGNVLKTTNGGQIWDTVLKPEISGKYRYIHFINPLEGFVWTTYSGGCVTNDGGLSWSYKPDQLSYSINDIAYPKGYVGIAVTNIGSIIRVNGPFESIENLTINNATDPISSIDFYSPSAGVLGTYSGEFFTTFDSGTTWSKKVTTYIVAFERLTAFSKSYYVIRDDFSKQQLYYNDSTLKWVSIPESSYWKTFFKLPYSDTVVSMVQETLFLSENRGKSWIKKGTSPLIGSFVYFNNSKNGFVTDKKGTVVKTSDGGISWENLTSLPANTEIRDIWFSDENTGWISGITDLDPVIFRTNDGGKVWKSAKNFEYCPQFQNLNNEVFIKVRSFDKSNIWALKKKAVLFSDDSGVSWKQQIIPQYCTAFTDMYIHKDGRLFLSADNGRVWRYLPDSTSGVKGVVFNRELLQFLISYNKNVISLNLVSLAQPCDLIIFNLNGRTLYKKNIRLSEGKNIKLPGLSTGAYVAQLRVGKRYFSKSFIVQ